MFQSGHEDYLEPENRAVAGEHCVRRLVTIFRLDIRAASLH